ncbi:unnamed protein product [Dicrocoelium dendriticum]|nr:unnamed protein product [Dicrocoelium dendriticum]
MSRRFSPHNFLVHKMNEVSFGGLQDYFKTNRRAVGAYTCGEFHELCSERPMEYIFRGVSFLLDDTTALLPKALANTVLDASDLDTGKRFLMDLLGELQSIRQVLSAACVHSAFPDDAAMITDVFSIVLPKLFESTNCPDVLRCSALSNSPVYIVGESETDSLFHIGCILRRIISALTLNASLGLVVLCHSKTVAIALQIFTILVDKCSPPSNLFSFIPAIVQQSEEITMSFGQTLSVIFHSSDMEAAANSSLSLICSGSSKWRSSIILLEEAAEVKFHKKLEHLLINKFQVQTNSTVPEKFIQSLQRDFGAKLLNKCNASTAPWIVCDLSPSALSGDALWHARDVGFIIRFRTAREAHLIASHFINRFQFEQRRILDTGSNSDLAVNLWLNSTALPWQLGLALLESGAQSIFVNTPPTQLLSSMYTGGLEFYGDMSPTVIRGDAEHDDHIELQREFTKVLYAAFKAQKAWISQGLCGVKRSIFNNMGQFACLSEVVASAWNLFLRFSNDFIGGQRSFDFKSEADSVVDSLLLSRQWLMPLGPVIFILTEDFATSASISKSFLQTIFQALFSGNAVFVIALAAPIESILSCHPSLSTISALFPSDLITVKSYQDLSYDELKDIFRSIRHPGVFIDPKTIWNSSTETNDKQCLSFSSRRTIFLSIDNKLFCN